MVGVGRLRGFVGLAVAVTVLLGGMEAAAAAPPPPKASPMTVLLARLAAEAPQGVQRQGPRRSFPVAGTQWDGITGLDPAYDSRLRDLVEDIAELSPEPEVRDAAAAALVAGTDQAIEEFLATGEPAAQAKARSRRNAQAASDLTSVKALAGTGGPVFRAELARVLAGSAEDRSAFLAYGAEIARSRTTRVRRMPRTG